MWMDYFTLNEVETEIRDSSRDKADGLAITDANGKLLDEYIPDTAIASLPVSANDPLQMTTKDWLLRAVSTNYGTKHPVFAATTSLQVAGAFPAAVGGIGYLPASSSWLFVSQQLLYTSTDGITLTKITQVSSVRRLISAHNLAFILCSINNQYAWFVTDDGQNFSATNLPTTNYSRLRIYYSSLFSAYLALDAYDENNAYAPLPSTPIVGLRFCSSVNPAVWSEITTFSSDTIYSIHENSTYLVVGTTRGTWSTTELPVFTQTQSSQVKTITITSVTYLPSVDLWLAVYSGGNEILYSVGTGPVAWGFGASVVHKHLKAFADVCYSFGSNNAGTSVASKCTTNGTSWSSVNVKFSFIEQLPNGRILASGTEMYYSDNKTSFTMATLDGAPFSNARLLALYGSDAYAISVASSPGSYCHTADGANWSTIGATFPGINLPSFYVANGVYSYRFRFSSDSVEEFGLLKPSSGTYFLALKLFKGLQLGVWLNDANTSYEHGGVLSNNYRLQLLDTYIPTHKMVCACDCSDSVICAATEDGVYCSPDNSTYTLVLAASATHVCLGYASKYNVWLYAAGATLYRSTDGVTWTTASTIVSSTSYGGAIYETAHFLCYSKAKTLYYSSDAGLTWQSYAFSENVANVLETSSGALVVVLKTSVYKTTDYATWSLIFQEASTSLHCAYTESELLLSSDVTLHALTKISYDEGNTWQDVDNVASAVGTLQEGLFYRILRSHARIQLSHNGTVWAEATKDAQSIVSINVAPTPINTDLFLVSQGDSTITELRLSDFLYNPLTQ